MKCHVIFALIAALTEANTSFLQHTAGLQVRGLMGPMLVKRTRRFHGSQAESRQKDSRASSSKQQMSVGRFESPPGRKSPKDSSTSNDNLHKAVVTAELRGPSKAAIVHGNDILRPVVFSAAAGQTKSHEFTHPRRVMATIENGPGGRATLVGTAKKGSTKGEPELGTAAQFTSELHSQAGQYQYMEAGGGQVSRAKGFSGNADGHVLLRGKLEGQGKTDMTMSNSPQRTRERHSDI